MDALLALEITKTMKQRVKDFRSAQDELVKTPKGRKTLDIMQAAIEIDIATLISTPEYLALVKPMPPTNHKGVSDEEKTQLHGYQEFGRMFPNERTFALNVFAITVD
jgi:hypothetical protein